MKLTWTSVDFELFMKNWCPLVWGIFDKRKQIFNNHLWMRTVKMFLTVLYLAEWRQVWIWKLEILQEIPCSFPSILLEGMYSKSHAVLWVKFYFPVCSVYISRRSWTSPYNVVNRWLKYTLRLTNTESILISSEN